MPTATGGGAVGRPSFWTPAWYLEWRRANPAAKMTKVYAEWAETWGTTVNSITSEIHRWKKLEPGFRSALAAVAPRANYKKFNSATLDDLKPTWRQDFLEALRDERGNKKAAAERIGGASLWQSIRQRLSKESPMYDQALSEIVALVEAELAEALRATIPKALEIATDGKDAKTMAWIAFRGLESLEPEKYGRQQTIRHEGRVIHEHRLQREKALEKAAGLSQKLFGAPADEIEGEVVRELPAAPEAFTVELIDEMAEKLKRGEVECPIGKAVAG